MTNTFFIGDTHFGHVNIIKYEPILRPFHCIEDMHEELIKRWNSVVRTSDKVFHLGDFCFGKKWLPIAKRLNGMKFLVGGNHDCYATTEYMKYFHKIVGATEFDKKILTHIPVHPSQFERYTHNIHGHLHSSVIMQEITVTEVSNRFVRCKNEPDKRYINVSAEQINLTPISYEEICKNISDA